MSIGRSERGRIECVRAALARCRSSTRLGHGRRLLMIINTTNRRTNERTSEVKVPGLTTPYSNEDSRRRGKWV